MAPVVIDMSEGGAAGGDPYKSLRFRKWKGSIKYPIGVAVIILALAGSGFAVGIRGLQLWVQALLAVCTVVSLVFLFLVNQIDPGAILPNPTKDPVVDRLEADDETIENRHMYRRGWKGQWQRRLKDGTVEKYCTTCNIWRPPGASHCSTCGYCMERFDHHCQVIGNCVARSNHRFFVVFLIACQIGCGVMSAGVAYRLQQLGFPESESWVYPETIVLLFLNVIYVYVFLMLFFGVGHLCSIVCNMTTKDLLTDGEGPSDLPCVGSRSCGNLFKSWVWVCCAPVHWKHSMQERIRARDKEMGFVPASDLPSGAVSDSGSSESSEGSEAPGSKQEGLSGFARGPTASMGSSEAQGPEAAAVASDKDVSQ